MDFLSGTLFGVGVSGFFVCLFFPGALHKLSHRIQSLEAEVSRLANKKSRDDGDWWKEGVPYDEGE